ncbi:hypothetical protein KFL_000050320 [Klebsormidium nitens]|uniref:Uncharacterized protein n=1 Tax=Klebsormidium nitens TaxID=105231 RepID=A0A1Y1HHF6_KLENI|nr:hypothetical protein KFL_000050320 [Klebsormidium nitens]|eukprot:GAQ77895.1 hypothetical protein KFL_000050320 [Klebsormidium nitens]
MGMKNAPEDLKEEKQMPLSLLTESKVRLGPLLTVELHSAVDGELTRIVYVQSFMIDDTDPEGRPEISLWEVRRTFGLREDAPLFHWEGSDSRRCFFRRNVLGPRILEFPPPLLHYTQNLKTPGGLPVLPVCTNFTGGVQMDRRTVSWLLVLDATAVGLAFHRQIDFCAPRGMYETIILPLALLLLWCYLIVGCFGHVTECVSRKAKQSLGKDKYRVIERLVRGFRSLLIGAIMLFPLWLLFQPLPVGSTLSTSDITSTPSAMNETVSYYKVDSAEFRMEM